MVDSKYTKCVDIDFENFPDCLYNNNNNGNRYLMTSVGKFGTFYECYLAAEGKLNEEDDREFFVFGILFIGTWGRDNIETRYKCFIKNYNKPDVQCEEVKEILSPQYYGNDNYKYTENFHDMEEILDEQNGLLKNGRLKIRLEISVVATIAPNGLRQWEFPRFEPDTKQWVAINLGCSDDSMKVYANRQIIEFHASSLPKNDLSCNEDKLDRLLQIMHGVQPFFSYNPLISLFYVLDVAKDYQIHNVLRICEQHFISEYRHGSGYWNDALKYNLGSYLKVQMENVKSPMRLKKRLKKMKWERSSAEIMKHLAAKFFSFV